MKLTFMVVHPFWLETSGTLAECIRMRGSVILVSIWLLVMTATVQAQFNFITNADNTLTITGYTGSGGSVTIPATNNGLTVTSIGTNAFQRKNSINAVTIPDSVTNIADNAFVDCSPMFNVTIGNGVINIGNDAFEGCQFLSTVSFGNNLKVIGNSAFSGCPLNSIAIPNTVTSIGDGAFFLSHIGGVTISSSLTNLGVNPFASCASLTAIGVSSNNPAFTNLGGVLFNKNQTALLAYPAGKTNGTYIISTNVTSIGSFAFSGCGNLTNLSIANSVTTIGSKAFGSAYKLPNATIPASVTNLGAAPFQACAALTNINVDSNNPAYASVSGCLFDKTQSIFLEYPVGNSAASYSVPAGVTNIAYGAFLACTHLTSVSIPAGVVTIGDYGFEGCSSLTNIVIPNSVTNIGTDLFYNCSALKTATLPSSLTSIPQEMFLNAGLASVVIPNNVTNIGIGAFVRTSLTNIVIPASVLNIGDEVFFFCLHLNGVFFQGNAPVTVNSAFSQSTNAIAYYLPGTSGWGSILGGIPTVLWNPVIQTGDGGFGLQNNQFGFNITGTTNIPIAVKVSSIVAGAPWTSVTNINLTNGLFHFSEPFASNSPVRYYRISSP